VDAAVDDPGPRLLSGPTAIEPGAATDDDDGRLLRVEATVPVGLDDAFAAFVDRLDRFWPDGSPLAAVDATLTHWDAPRRIRATWAPGSHVDVAFAPVQEDLTTVIVEHRHLGVHDAALRRLVAGDDGWWGALRAYVAAARGLVQK
jgi:hypothetical protein